jgi:basic membrane protein A
LRDPVASGRLNPLDGPITRQDGKVVIPQGGRLKDDQIRAMNCFYRGIDATIPT